MHARRGEDAEEDKEQQRRARPAPLDDLAGQLTCAVVLSDPGSGKTEWLRWRARQAAGHCLAALDRGAAPADLEVPIFARLDAVARQLARSDEQLLGALGDIAGFGPAERLAAALILTIEKDDPSARPLRAWLWQRLTGVASPASAPLRVYLDAWDEVRAGRDLLLQSLVAFIEAGQATLFLTSRIVGYEPGGLPVDGTHAATRRTLQVQPFAWDQTVTFVERFFAGEPATRDEMRAQLRALQRTLRLFAGDDGVRGVALDSRRWPCCAPPQRRCGTHARLRRRAARMRCNRARPGHTSCAGLGSRNRRQGARS